MALLFGVFYWSSAPDMKQLFVGLEPTEQGRVIQKLQELKIPYKQEVDGSILVPNVQVAEARARLAQSGLPSSGALGNIRLGEMGMTDTQRVQDEKVRVALEEEMQKTIEAISAVAAAKVHIAPGDDSPFLNAQSEPSASVLLQLRPSSSAPRDVAEVVVRVMVGAVRGLKSSNVSVSDSNGIVLYDGGTDQGGSVVASKKRDAELNEAERMRREIERMISQTVGPGKAVVSANVEMIFDGEHVVTTSEEGSKNPISQEKVTESMSKPGGITGGTPAAVDRAAAGSPGYSLGHEKSNFGSVVTRSEKSVAPGTLKSVRVSIMLDDSAKAQEPQIKSFAENLIGSAKDPDNFTVAVTSVAFDKSAAENAAKELAAAKGGQTMQQVFSLIPILALIVVGFLVIKAVGKAAANNRSVLVAAGGLQPLTVRQLPQQSRQYQQANQGGGHQTQDLALPEEQLSAAAQARRDAIRRSIRPEVDDIPEKFDINLEQILKMADGRPESVALLVKSWLLEETN